MMPPSPDHCGLGLADGREGINQPSASLTCSRRGTCLSRSSSRMAPFVPKKDPGWGVVVWQRPARQEHLSVLVLALCSSTQLYRACMRRGADYHQPDQPAKVSLEHDHTQPLSLTSRWRWDKHAPLACVLIPWHLPPLYNPDLQNKLNSRTYLARSQEWSANVRTWTCPH